MTLPKSNIPKTPTFNDILNLLDGTVDSNTIKKSLAVAKNETFEKQNIVIFAEAPSYFDVIGRFSSDVTRAFRESISKAGDDVDIMSLKPSERRDIIWSTFKNTGVYSNSGVEEKQAMFKYVNNIAHAGLTVEELQGFRRPLMRMQESSNHIRRISRFVATAENNQRNRQVSQFYTELVNDEDKLYAFVNDIARDRYIDNPKDLVELTKAVKNLNFDMYEEEEPINIGTNHFFGGKKVFDRKNETIFESYHTGNENIRIELDAADIYYYAKDAYRGTQEYKESRQTTRMLKEEFNNSTFSVLPGETKEAFRNRYINIIDEMVNFEHFDEDIAKGLKEQISRMYKSHMITSTNARGEDREAIKNQNVSVIDGIAAHLDYYWDQNQFISNSLGDETWYMNNNFTNQAHLMANRLELSDDYNVVIYPVYGKSSLDQAGNDASLRFNGKDVQVAVLGHDGYDFAGVDIGSDIYDFYSSKEFKEFKQNMVDKGPLSKEAFNLAAEEWFHNTRGYVLGSDNYGWNISMNSFANNCNITDIFVGACGAGDDADKMTAFSSVFGGGNTWGQSNRWGSAKLTSKPDNLFDAMFMLENGGFIGEVNRGFEELEYEGFDVNLEDSTKSVVLGQTLDKDKIEELDKKHGKVDKKALPFSVEPKPIVGPSFDVKSDYKDIKTNFDFDEYEIPDDPLDDYPEDPYGEQLAQNNTLDGLVDWMKTENI